MGCTCVKIHKAKSKVAHQLNCERPRWLSNAQIAVIRNNWQVLKLHIANVGVITFVGMFESHPELQKLFSDFRNKEVSEIRQNGLLRHHALRVMSTIDKCITGIDDKEEFKTILREVGASHKKYNVPSENIMIILPHFLRAIKPQLDDYWSEDMAEAWKALFGLIVYHINEGMNRTEDEKQAITDTFAVT